MVSENPDTEDDLSEIRALNSGKTSASGETVGYMSNPQVPLNQKGIHLTYPINPPPPPFIDVQKWTIVDPFVVCLHVLYSQNLISGHYLK